MGQKGPIGVGQRIRETRTRRRMTQSALADKLGIPYQLVQQYERGERLSIERLFAIAQALEIDPGLLTASATHPKKLLKPELIIPPKLGFYGRQAKSKRVDVDAQVKAACGVPADAPAQLVWDHWYDRIHPDDRALVDAQLARISDPRDGVFDMRYRLVGCDGIERYILDFGRMTFDGQQPVRLQGMMLDITSEPRTKNAIDDVEKIKRKARTQSP